MYYYADEFDDLLKENPDDFFGNPDVLLGWLWSKNKRCSKNSPP